MKNETLVNIVNAGSTVVKSSTGYLAGIVINKSPAGGLKLYDAASVASVGSPFATIAAADAAGPYPYKGHLTNGLVVINGDAVRASTVLTSDNTADADGSTVTIDSTVYRFKTTPEQAYDVKLTATADTNLSNLIKAINASGLGDGSDYFAGTLAHPSVTAGTTITAHHFTITAILYGTAANSIATTTTATHLSFTGSTLASGAEGSAFDITASVE